MDVAELRERRAARDRQVRRRRRRTVGAGALVALLACAAALAAGGGSPAPAPASRQPERVATAATTAAASAARVVSARRRATARQAAALRTPAVGPPAALPGAHRAPHEAVPILMYHVIGTRGPQTTNPGLWVSPADFTAQVAALKRGGYHAVTLGQVWDAWHRRGELPRKPVVLSFDDGYRGQVRDALPALAATGWAGVLNLKLDNLADMGGSRAIRRLVRAGWEIDAHTITHPDLTTVDAARLRDEVAGSRTRLRRLFGGPVSFFCYPSGRYDPTVIAAVKAAGFLGATTTHLGWASPAGDRFTLPRVRVDGEMTPAALLARLRGTRPATMPAGA
jgi:peptidoglycan/xylan/chitin deacetylase (PgdA/CDA1 family)